MLIRRKLFSKENSQEKERTKNDVSWDSVYGGLVGAAGGFATGKGLEKVIGSKKEMTEEGIKREFRRKDRG